MRNRNPLLVAAVVIVAAWVLLTVLHVLIRGLRCGPSSPRVCSTAACAHGATR